VTLYDIASEARSFLLETAAPLWSAHRTGDAVLFPERLSLLGERQPCPHRLFVQARHIFSYCEIGRLGWIGPWREFVADSIAFLLVNGRRADGFYVHRFDANGRVLDARADLYDQAFMLFAFAHAGRATGRSEFFEAAIALDDTLEAHWRLPHGGYFEGEIAVCPPCRQNPHMHLLESFIALCAASGDARWRKRAEHIAAHCLKHFIDPVSGALTEYFDAQFQPTLGDEGRIVEPGHCFEWAWLFEILVSWGVSEAIEASNRLTAFARKFGIDKNRGVAINEVLTDGTIRNADARLWSQAERLKAALARYRRTKDAREVQEARDAYAGLVKYFHTSRRGIWRDKLLADGSWVEGPALGSSLYHITCALAELMDLVGESVSGG
jgi:mannose-6-phosphate isomerase